MDLKDLYRDVIVDHNRNPRNFRAMPDADRHAEGFNPLCGDRLTLYVKLEGETIRDVSFEGSGCAISVASGMAALGRSPASSSVFITPSQLRTKRSVLSVERM